MFKMEGIITKATFKLMPKSLNPGIYLFPVLKTGTAQKRAVPVFLSCRPCSQAQPALRCFWQPPRDVRFLRLFAGVLWRELAGVLALECFSAFETGNLSGFGLRPLVSRGFLGAKA